MFTKRILTLVLVIASIVLSQAQTASIKATHPKYKAYVDSLKNAEYNYTFPIWGERVYKKGFDIPYPAGIMVNSFVASQKMLIDEIGLGVNNSEIIDFSGLITFSDIEASIVNINVRPDLYVFPFLNVYGILGYSWSQTRVVLSSPIALETTAELEGKNYGFGLNLAAGAGPVWLSGDANMVWADLDKFVKPVLAVNTSFRVGHTFVDWDQPDRNIAVWVGAFGSFIDNRTTGSINLSEVLGDSDKLEEIRDQLGDRYEAWYETLGPAQKVVIDQIEEEIRDRLDGQPPREIIIKYDLLKRPANPWNMVIGFQYQFNKNWMLRTEAGMLGKRSQLLLSLNYRFRI